MIAPTSPRTKPCSPGGRSPRLSDRPARSRPVCEQARRVTGPKRRTAPRLPKACPTRAACMQRLIPGNETRFRPDAPRLSACAEGAPEDALRSLDAALPKTGRKARRTPPCDRSFPGARPPAACRSLSLPPKSNPPKSPLPPKTPHRSQKLKSFEREDGGPGEGGKTFEGRLSNELQQKEIPVFP